MSTIPGWTISLMVVAVITMHVLGDIYNDNPEGYLHYYPDCVRIHPELNMTDEEAAMDLFCKQRDAPAGAIRVACVGDSITAVGHSSDKAHQYPSQLQIMLDVTHGQGTYSVTNLGACGATLSKTGASPYWNRSQYKALIAAKWDIVILMLGTNDARDIGSGGPEHWPATCNNASISSLDTCPFAVDYKAMLDVIKGLGTMPTGPEIYIMIPPPLMQQGAYGMNQTIINTIFPNLIPLIYQANKKNIHSMIDIYSGFGGVSDWKTKYPDQCVWPNSPWTPCVWYCDEQSCKPGQCHPNNVGCTHLAELVKESMLQSSIRMLV